MTAKEKLKKELIHTFSIINPAGEYMEIRILNSNTGTLSGYFNSAEDIYNAVHTFDSKYNIFFTLNELSPKIIARSQNHFTKYAKNTTAEVP